MVFDKEFTSPFILSKSYDEDGKWYIEGYAALTGPDNKEPIIALTPEALNKMIRDLDELKTVFLEHDWKTPVGVVVDKKIKEGNKLWVKILISKTAKDIWQMIKEGVLNSLSIGGKVLNAVKKFDNKLKKFIYEVLDARLFEISIVGLPANPKAKINKVYIAKSMLDAIGGDMENKEILEEKKEEELIEKNFEEAEKNSEEDIKEESSTDISKSAENNGEKDESSEQKEDVSEDFEKAKAKAKEKYPKPYGYYYGLDVVTELKKLLRKKKIEDIKAAIKELITKLEGSGYYYKKNNEENINDKDINKEDDKEMNMDKNLKNEEEKIDVEDKKEEVKKKDASDEILKALEDIKNAQITEEKVIEIVKRVIDELPDASALRKSQVKAEDDSKEIKKAFESLDTEQKLKLILQRKYGL